MKFILMLIQGLLPLLYMLFFVSIQSSNAQDSRWNIFIGFEHLINSPKLTNNIAVNSYTWEGIGDEEYFQFNAGPVTGYRFGASYDLFPWWSIGLEHRRLYRRYYMNGIDPRVPDLEFLDYSYWSSLTDDKFLGATLNMYSWSLKTDFKHKIFSSDLWNLHYFFGLNLDQYENNRRRRDVPIFVSISSDPEPENTNRPYGWETSGKIEVVTDFNGSITYLPSLNLGIGISRKVYRNIAMKFELAYRYIGFTKSILARQNGLILELEHERYYYREDMTRDVFLFDQTEYHFPLYLGGIYFNISCVYELGCREYQNVKK